MRVKTCGRGAITKNLSASGNFYVAQPPGRLDFALIATKPSFGGAAAYQGAHPSLPLKGQLTIITDLQEATAAECAGQLFPAERCERTLPVKTMEFEASAASWSLEVKAPPLSKVRCLDYLPLSDGSGEILTPIYGRPRNYSLRAKMLLGKTFTLSRSTTKTWGSGTSRLAWTFTFTRLR